MRISCGGLIAFASLGAGLWGWAHKLQESHADASEFGVSLPTLDFASAVLTCRYNQVQTCRFFCCAAQT